MGYLKDLTGAFTMGLLLLAAFAVLGLVLFNGFFVTAELALVLEGIDLAGSTDVPIEARCIRGNTGYAVLDFVQSVDAMMLVVPDSSGTVGVATRIEWVTDVIPCNLWVVR